MRKRLWMLNVVLFAMLFFVGCACSYSDSCTMQSPTVTESLNKEKIRNSFVFIKTAFKAEFCDAAGENCVATIKTPTIFVSSGSIIKSNNTGSVILTAGHSCRKFFSYELPGVFPVLPPGTSLKLETIFSLITFDGVLKDDVQLVSYDFNNLDICLLRSNSLTNREHIDISRTAPKYGDKVYNVAAPKGLFFLSAIPFFEGYYSGTINRNGYELLFPEFAIGMAVQDLYALPVKQGSSGSPILNERGELLALIHSKHPDFDYVAFAISHSSFVKYLQDQKILPDNFLLGN